MKPSFLHADSPRLTSFLFHLIQPYLLFVISLVVPLVSVLLISIFVMRNPWSVYSRALGSWFWRLANAPLPDCSGMPTTRPSPFSWRSQFRALLLR